MVRVAARVNVMPGASAARWRPVAGVSVGQPLCASSAAATIEQVEERVFAAAPGSGEVRPRAVKQLSHGDFDGYRHH
jgi:hypothetical protein